MKCAMIGLSLLCFAGLGVISVSHAQSADDRKWVNQCLADNSDAKVSIAVVRAYCVCMNDKMDDSETRSISVWEKANPSARRACEQEAGW
ncbi:hypothetical protein MCEMSEM23_01461 [Rhabdaerophilaceae bacterium]